MKYDYNRRVGEESKKSYKDKIDSEFFDKYMTGKGAELGFAGYIEGCVPILENCDGYDINTPGYDGKTIPVSDGYYDYVYSSHTLEHISDYKQAIKEWFRVVKEGGYIVTVVPHRDLYEKKLNKPSHWNADHKHFITPSVLLKFFEESLEPNTYRVRLLQDCDKGHNYKAGPEIHGNWQYEILLVVQKLFNEPKWRMK